MTEFPIPINEIKELINKRDCGLKGVDHVYLQRAIDVNGFSGSENPLQGH